MLGGLKVDVVDGERIPFPRGVFSRKPADELDPLPLRHFELAHPEAVAKCHFDLILAWPAFRFVTWAPHHKDPWWAPAKRNPSDRSLVARDTSFEALFGAGER
jgi:hypothetical protein